MEAVSLEMGPGMVRVHSLERIAGEKIRAYVSSLPAHRARMNDRGGATRFKDLHDLALIRRTRPATDFDFWRLAGEEFRLACRSRDVRCPGPATFFEGWADTRRVYERLLEYREIPFDEVEKVLIEIANELQVAGIIPL